ncbi:hypothetical protein SAMN02983003_1653 [Devosia enhydra]|uniref:Uncharacterized protein n=1 Tax=Devosia enhydra TaxID=665118 RepID=A0A1K2HWP3_9HYPH|nr:hypothetical protein [Devosia enhydra]SFZ83454.1 hypothetical protein SAMN02983003_1653 [Devosia enhydra]
MPIVPNTVEEPTSRDRLVFYVMFALNRAVEGVEQVSTYELAEQIVELVEETQEREALSR